MDLKELIKAIQENANNPELIGAVKQLVKFDIGENDVKNYLETDDGKKLMQPRLDSYFNKGLATWRDNNESKLRDEIRKEIELELNPPANPWEQRVKELEDENKQRGIRERKLLAKDAARKVLKYPEMEDLLDNFTYEDAELSKSVAGKINNILDEMVKTGKLASMKETTRIPKTGEEEDKAESFFNPKSPDYNLTEINNLWHSDPKRAKMLDEKFSSKENING